MKKKYKVLLSLLCVAVSLCVFSISSFAVDAENLVVKTSLYSCNENWTDRELLLSFTGFGSGDSEQVNIDSNFIHEICIFSSYEGEVVLDPGYELSGSIQYFYDYLDSQYSGNLIGCDDLYYTLVYTDGSEKTFRNDIDFLEQDELLSINFDINGGSLPVTEIRIYFTFTCFDFVDFDIEESELENISGYFNIGFVEGYKDEYLIVNSTFNNNSLFAILSNIGTFFSQSVTWTGEVLNVVVSSPALLIMVVAMIVIGFAVGLLTRSTRM